MVGEGVMESDERERERVRWERERGKKREGMSGEVEWREVSDVEID